jgi:hypothetical protein
MARIDRSNLLQLPDVSLNSLSITVLRDSRSSRHNHVRLHNGGSGQNLSVKLSIKKCPEENFSAILLKIS